MNIATKSLFRGSVILFIAFNLYNAINFLFQFSMARMLSVSDYGTLAALFSILYLTGIFTESIQTVIAKYSSKEYEAGKLKNLLNKALRKSSKVALISFILYCFIAIVLSYFMKIAYSLLLINGIMIFFSFLLPVNRGLMLGRKKFRSLGINMIVESVLKLVLSIFLVWLGWKIYGALAALIIGSLFAFIFSFSSFKELKSSKEENAETTNIYAYAKPVIFLMSIIIVFYSLDVLIAKIVFSSEIAGYYAIASILSKALLWGTIPISKAMFPLSAENLRSKSAKSIALSSILILSSILTISLVIFYLFPSILIKIFSGKYIIESSQILFYTAISMALISITNLIILYKLSQGRTKGYYFFIIFILIEITLLFMFSSSLLQYSISFLVSSLIFLIGSIFLLKKDNN